MDNIDWVAVKEKEPMTSSAANGANEESINREMDVVSSYKTMLELMKPKETVLRGKS